MQLTIGTANILIFLPLLNLPPFSRFDLRDPGGGDRAVHQRVPPADQAQRQHGRLHRHRPRPLLRRIQRLPLPRVRDHLRDCGEHSKLTWRFSSDLLLGDNWYVKPIIRGKAMKVNYDEHAHH